ncbi:MAG: hypothetical protein UU65_C0002G0253 [candidate division CPR2 bacterium GW2011_GWC1_41_48]|uniref:Peptidase C39-like domain-containing protein n=1 Tax=candidate division CPR2 bacterium GW2011_GWC1_41_48 TaxID=1618344 RepID=A0A0G0W916_UNCC2|nr:MAG: hypothetical protein UT47_C0002G0051 [candidate division CPR2 bacterium GW2011_GWC2_39_35]KKR28978.1 MAG: hypothetical protein UT60_C0008G0021 [candidate division CPR2 bacterium GW2011_GWD2_39_7]KKR29254.1 MAG: hypothetical protein UT59_C0010G0006 [candidate division CPR2 bacterium GW2011_GWD1_39_7]KKS09475.1 MAG: hypothetical protein UU65_C0002G0253 [candidate division CPR2 bacterium GW2011_GWC1_41_48]OGB62183.1 MAG: hypothetical protein A2Y27_00745 [candidate division CPR2 bacterium G
MSSIKRKHVVIILSILAILIIVGFGMWLSFNKANENIGLDKREPNLISVTPEAELNKGEDNKTTPTPSPLPTAQVKESVTLTAPYTVQAPFANWAVHEESCEEAALLMYHYFLEGQTDFNGSSVIEQHGAANDMLAMKNWQVKNYGREPDLTIEAWSKFAQEYYGYKPQTFKNITKEDIKKEIAAGHPVVVPVITHALENPHYGRQPSYHVLIIKGYKPEGIITNDPGVKEGENYFYTWDILFSAIDAQTSKMGQGREMAVIYK